MSDISEGPACPLPLPHQDTIILGHGSGGKLTHDLVKSVFAKWFTNPILDEGDDAARITLGPNDGYIVTSTDAHVVNPLFFPGGDIGRLAVCGTVNDVAMLGATPRYLTAAFIIEEGLPVSILEEVAHSMNIAASEAGVLIVAGDTKVVEKGKVDRLFISTTGIGIIPAARKQAISGNNALPGDVVILSGSIGDHGIAVLSARNDLNFEVAIRSDVAPLNHMIAQLIEAAPSTRVLRDPTRGGLATSLNEIATQSRISIRLFEDNIPVRDEVRAACEMLGFEPVYLANEGKVIIIVPESEATAALEAVRKHPYGQSAAVIGKVTASEKDQYRVILETAYGTSRILPVLAGEILPRIC